MKEMLLNLTNHPSSDWPANQLQLANEIYGSVRDMLFPEIDPNWSTEEVKRIANQKLDEIMLVIDPATDVVHVMGEMTFNYTLVQKLQNEGVRCVASTTHRIMHQNKDGARTYYFEFVKFREYGRPT